MQEIVFIPVLHPVNGLFHSVFVFSMAIVTPFLSPARPRAVFSIQLSSSMPGLCRRGYRRAFLALGHEKIACFGLFRSGSGTVQSFTDIVHVFNCA